MAQETSLRVGVDSRDAKKGAAEVDNALRKTRAEAEKTETQFEKLQDSLGGLRTVFAGIGIALIVREFAQLLDSATNINNRLRLVTNSTEEANAVFEELADISNSTRTGLEENANLFNRLSIATRELGLTFQDQLNLTKSLNQALIISGASAAEGGAGLIQLSQGLAAGALRGDELRSVLEGLPKVADVIATGLGVTRGELRELGEEGKISAKDVVDAFKDAAVDLQEEFNKIAPTIESALTVLNNKLLEFTRFMNDATGIGGILARGVLFLADNFNVLASIAAGFAAILTGVVIKSMVAFTIALATNPVGLFIIAVGALTAAMGILGDMTFEVAGIVSTGWQIMEAAVLTVWGFIRPIIDSWIGRFDELSTSVLDFADTLGFSLEETLTTIKDFASIAIGVIIAIPPTIISVLSLLTDPIDLFFGLFFGSLIATLEAFVNTFARILGGVGDIIAVFDEDLGRGIQTAITDALSVDLGRPEIFTKAVNVAEELDAVWSDAFRTDRLDDFGAAFDKNLQKVVDGDKAATDAQEILNRKFAEGNAIFKESKEIIKEREKFIKQIQKDFDRIREATGRATEVNDEWASSQLADLRRLGLENTKYAAQVEEIWLNRSQEARLADVENSQEWAADLTQTQRDVAGSVVDEFESIREARGENIDILNEWREAELAALSAVGLANSEFADKIEAIYADRLPAAREADLFAAQDSLSGIKQALFEYEEDLGSAADQTRNLFTDALDETEDVLVDFVKTGKLNFRDLIDTMIDDLIRLGIQQALVGAFSGGDGGAAGGIGGLVTGLFSEGGVSTSPVSTNVVPIDAFKNAQKFQTGGVQGGIPSILHEDEAVIPLSRGREVPVTLTDPGGKGETGDTIFNIQTPDAESFDRSQDQVLTRTARGLDRARRRNA